MTAILSEIISFLKNPYSQPFQILNRKEKFQYILKLGLFIFLINIAFALIIAIEKFVLNKYGIEIKEIDINFGKAYTILLLALFVPFYEELIFRLPLSLRKKDINVSLFTLLGIVGYILVLYCNDTTLSKITTSLINFIFLFSGVGVVYLFNIITEDSLEKLKISSGKYFVFGSIIIFTLLHLSNIPDFDIRLLLIYLFNLLPVFFLGTIISFCRLRLGFFYGFLFHAGWNFLFVIFKI